MAKILLVDDEPTIQKLVKADLVARGYEVVVASDGEEAMRQVRGEIPDLVILDLRIPKVSGWEVLDSIRADGSLDKTRVIVVTGAANEVEEERARSMGAVGCLGKPFSPRELAEQINLAIGPSAQE